MRSRLRDYLIRPAAGTEIPESCLNGDRRTNRLPNNVNISIAGVNGPAVVALLDLEGICASSASACSAGNTEGVSCAACDRKMPDSRRMRRSVLRLGYPEYTAKNLDDTVEVLKQCVKRLRESSRCHEV